MNFNLNEYTGAVSANPANLMKLQLYLCNLPFWVLHLKKESKNTFNDNIYKISK